MTDLEAIRLASRKSSLSGHSGRRAISLGLFFFAAIVLTLPTVPYLFTVSPGVASSSAAAGYSNRVAFQLAIIIIALCAAVFAMVSRFGLAWFPEAPESFEERAPKPGFVRIPELSVVFVSVGFLYLPWALNQTGPFTEDDFFLSVLHRMEIGQRPYLDFEFMYGPLMLFLPHLWLKAFGYSATSYYGYVAVVEAAKFTLLTAFLQFCFERFRARLTAFIILAPLLFNVLLGPNYDGIRQLLPAFILMVIAAHPLGRRTAVVVPLMAGALLAYSHEFGLACLAAIVAIYLLLAWKNGARENLTQLCVILVSSVASWLVIAGAILGKSFIPYLAASWNLARRYELGELGFPFYWTVNSLAVFGLLILTSALIGAGIGREKKGLLAGDLLLIGGFVYNLVSLKSGLNRCDLWHLTTPIFALALAFVIPWPSRLFLTQSLRRFGCVIILVISMTFLAGMAPAASHVFGNWFQGIKRLAVGGSVADQTNIESATPVIRNRLSTEIAPLRDYLISAGRDRPVVYYSRMWPLDKIIGVPNAAYTTTSALTSEDAGVKIANFLARNRNALVVIDLETYQRVFRIADSDQRPIPTDFYKFTLTKSIVSWLSTVHFRVIEGEIIAQDLRWDRTVGDYLRANHAPAAMLGASVVLADKSQKP
ncbi:MAG TPA: hypothetical protein VJ810_26155 [Blastocatellia bacterium]|nr:hypothetical protein [Blastocatellia bacterium]